MNTKSIKKGFTLTELIIVIVIIGILAGVLIPTFINVVNKANKAADLSLIRNLNEALTLDRYDRGEHRTMYEALKGVEEYGFEVEKIDAKVSKNKILWDSKNDVFCYLNGNELEYYPKSVSAENEVKRTNDDTNESYMLWIIDSTPSGVYSTYLYNVEDGASFEGVKTGIDAGEENVKSIEYVGTEGRTQDVVIRTNGGKLLINDKTQGSIKHYDNVTSLDIIKCHTLSYHEYGQVVYANIKEGHVSFEKNSSVEAVHFEKSDRGDKAETDPDTYNTIILSFAEGVEQPDYSRDKTIIDPNNGTKVCTLDLPEETNNIFLTLEGIYEQIQVQPAQVSGESAGVAIWVNTSDATDETKRAADQIANQYRNRESALAEGAEVAPVYGANEKAGARTFEEEEIKEQISDNGDEKNHFESKYTVNSLFADYLKLESIPGVDILADGYNIGLREEQIKGLYDSNKNVFNNIVYGVYYDDNGTDDTQDDDQLLLQNGRSYSAISEDSYNQDDGKYKYWHGDFVIKFNKTISAFDGKELSNNIILVGEYGDWGWLKFPLTEGLEADTELRLLDGYAGGIISINYIELCTTVKVFKCGAAYIAPTDYNTNDPLIMTIEFRLYETNPNNPNTKNEETGEYVIVDTYTYTFK